MQFGYSIAWLIRGFSYKEARQWGLVLLVTQGLHLAFMQNGRTTVPGRLVTWVLERQVLLLDPRRSRVTSPLQVLISKLRVSRPPVLLGEPGRAGVSVPQIDSKH